MTSDDLEEPQFLSVDDLAARYGVSPATVHTWIYTGTAPRSYKLGRHRRFKLRDVVIWEESRASDERSDAGATASDRSEVRS